VFERTYIACLIATIDSLRASLGTSFFYGISIFLKDNKLISLEKIEISLKNYGSQTSPKNYVSLSLCIN
jgi:hypothetical protein